MRLIKKDVILSAGRFRTSNRQTVGGKAWNLFRLLQNKIAVPSYIVITTRVFNRIVVYYRKDIDTIMNHINFNCPRSIKNSSNLIKEIFISMKLEDKFIKNLQETLKKIYTPDTLFSIRSSVVDEDSTTNSFAGQMDTFLNVSLPDIIDAVKKVWASAYSSRALVYRKQKKLGFDNISVAVIVQEMIQSTTSGILFTDDAEHNKKLSTISAGYGLGEGIVSNRVQTDTYKICRESSQITSKIGLKDFYLVFDSKMNKSNYYAKIPAKLRLKPVLNNQQILLLHDIGIKIEQYMGAPQDIEWAFDEHEKLFILQTRPIVSNPYKITSTLSRIWDNSNIIESYPGLTLPLTFSFIRKGYETALRNVAFSFVFMKKTIRKDLHIFKNMLGLIDGRVYYNLLNWYKMLSYLPGFERNKRAWDQMIGISERVVFNGSNISRIIKFLILLKIILKLCSVERTAKRFMQYFNFSYNKYKSIDISGANEHELIEIYESLWQEFMPKWHLTLQNDFYAMKYYDWLKTLCHKWGLDEKRNIHNNLLCGQKDIESTQPVQFLLRICQLLRSDLKYQELFNIMDNHMIWHNVQVNPIYRELRHMLNDYINRFGDRGLEELKLEKRTFRQRPSDLLSLIKHYYQQELSINEMQQREQEIRISTEKYVQEQLKNVFKRIIFDFVLRKTRQVVANRENMRFARSRLYGIVRSIFCRMADIFVAKGILTATSDIYYLTVEEIFGYVNGAAETQNLLSLIKIRKAEYTKFAKRNPKERLQTTDLPYLHILHETKNNIEQPKVIQGIGCSSGQVSGTAQVVNEPDIPITDSNYILITRSTDPGWIFMMIASKGIVVERGSMLSHTAIIGRELGIPTIVGAKEATHVIPPKSSVTINGSTGVVTWQ